ncbi:hypothetical protein ACS0TY_032767 [Phlomoides rotata]
MESYKVDTNATRVRHLREKILRSSPSVTQREKREQNVQTKPQQAFQVPKPGKTSSNLEDKETKHQESKPDYNSTWKDLLKGSGFKPDHFTTDISVYESWHNKPHLKRGEELEIKFILIANEDTTKEIKYPTFHLMMLQRLDEKTFNYIKEQETKSALVVNLTEDEIFTIRVLGV